MGPRRRERPDGRAAVVARLVLAGTVLLPFFSSAAPAQRLAGVRTVTVAPVAQSWRFSRPPEQPPFVAGDAVRVRSVSQWSVPIAGVVPLGATWTLDASAAVMNGSVVLDRTDPESGRSRYSVSGLTDVRVRAVGRVRGDALLVVMGVNLPAGVTGLSDEEFAAMRVLAAPALRFGTPALGAGASGTLGVVGAREVGEWGLAGGLALEWRGAYEPLLALGDVARPEFDPGSAVRMSLGADGLVGANGVTFGIAVDLYSTGTITLRDPASGGTIRAEGRPGPTISATGEMRLASARIRDLTLHLSDRYRTGLHRDGAPVRGGSGNELDVGIRGRLPLRSDADLMLGMAARHFTGSGIDDALATAAIASISGSAGFAWRRGSWSVLPLLRAEVGRIDTGGSSSGAVGLSAGLSVRTDF